MIPRSVDRTAQRRGTMIRALRASIPRDDGLPRLARREPLVEDLRQRGEHLVGDWVLIDPLVDHLGVDEPEVGDARARAVLDELDPQRAAELLDRGLAHRVWHRADAVPEGVDRCHDDDVPAAPDDLRQRDLDGVATPPMLTASVRSMFSLTSHAMSTRARRCRRWPSLRRVHRSARRSSRRRAASRRGRSRRRRCRARGCRRSARRRPGVRFSSRSTITTVRPALAQHLRRREPDPARARRLRARPCPGGCSSAIGSASQIAGAGTPGRAVPW